MSGPVTIALGSNLGDRLAHLQRGVQGLAALGISGLAGSSVYESAAQGIPEDAPDFLNAVVTGRTVLAPRALLNGLMAVEGSEGRRRSVRGAPRTLDLDLLFYGTDTISEPGLVVPHPRWRERSFVLAPLSEVEPDRIDEATGLPVRELWKARGSELGCVRRVAPPSALLATVGGEGS